ncbi:MAG TPA: TonB-dependent siderophore receptor [Burkholderiales bacterium]|nr:TonB-dependent siderophore receptor [Burkholderiales bacterium]
MKHRFTKRRLAAAIAMTLAPFAPHAHSAAPAEATLPEVKVQDSGAANEYAPAISTVGSKTPTPIRDIPQSITVINRAVLDAQAATSLTDALRNVPGITLSAGEGGVIGDNINLRGFSARTDIYMDGMRDRGQYARDTFFLDSVEVLKGPSSLLFGRGSTGGVINQVTKRPDLHARTEVSASVGTDHYYRSTLDFNRAISDTAAFRVAAVAHDAKSTRDVTETNRYGVAPSLRFGIGTPTEFTLAALVQRNRDVPDYGFPLLGGRPVDAPPERFYGFTDDAFDQDINVVTATINHRVSPALTLRNQTQYGRYRTDASPTPVAIVGAPAPGTPLELINANRNTRDRVLEDSSLVNQTDLIVKAATGGIQHTIVAGVEIAREEFHTDSYTWTGLGTVNLGNPAYGPKPASATRALNTATEVDADTFAVYVHDQIDLTKHWKLVGGLRWDRFSADSSQVAAATGVRTELGRTDKMVSTRAGVIWQPTEMQSYYVSYGTSFNPSAETLTLNANTAALAPEKSRSYEIGAKWDFLDGGLMLNTALFRVEKTNARTTDPITRVQTLEGDIRVDGAELAAVGRITRLWQIIAAYTLLDGEILSSRDVSGAVAAQGKTPQNTPRHTASLWTTYRIAPEWEAGGGLVASSKRFVNNFETAEIAGYTRYDATLAYIQKAYEVRLNLQNITDKTYFETASGGRAVPVRGRTAIVTGTFRF